MNKIDNLIYNYSPEYSLDLQGWNGLNRTFHDLISYVKPQIIVEVGTWKGQSAINMADICSSLKLNTKIYCIDTWLGAEEFWNDLSGTTERDLKLKYGFPQIYYQFLSNVIHKKHQNTIIPFPNTSHIGATYLKKRKIKADLIYIDASHEELDVYNDINDYWDIIQPTGIIFGDDYGWTGVKNSVNKVSKEKCKEIKVLENQYWSFQF